MTELMNQIRFYFYISGVLRAQESDPLCGKCKAFANTAARMKEGFSGLDRLFTALETIQPEMRAMADTARTRLGELRIPEHTEGQKKAGRCTMPEGVCFVKASKAIRDRIQE